MAKKNAIVFDKFNTKGVIKIQLNKDEYVIRNNEYFVNKAIKELQKMDEDEEAFDALDHVFNALSYLYGENKVEEIAEKNPAIDWGEFLKFSIAMASGMTKEQYDEQIEEDSKNA